MNVRKDEPLKDGLYQTILKSIEKKQTKYGERLMWLFSVPEHNAEVAGFTSLSESTQARAYIWATALNPEIATKESWSSEDVVGKKCTLVVEVYEDEKSRMKNKMLQVKPPKGG